MKDRRGQLVMILWIFLLCFITVDAAPCQDTSNWRNWCGVKCPSNEYPYNSTQNEYAHCKKTCNICESETQCGHGYYGKDCKPCIYRCQGDTCEDARTGECSSNCPDRLYGYKCDKQCQGKCIECDQWTGVCSDCEDGYYGRYCFQRCPENCGDDVCFSDTGECDYCKPTWKGERCTEKEKICKNCARHDCDDNGVCTNGCKDDKWFGPKCEDKCNSNCKNKTCKNDTGNCLLGCKNTFHGWDCSLTCSDNCAGRRCEQNGSCKSCVSGKFGNDCSSSCSPNCESTCYRKTGKCKACTDGWYGYNCTNSCENCLTGCVKKGVCKGGCKVGYFGKKCDKTCNRHCMNNECEKTTGFCSRGCEDTWYGANCSHRCSSDCVNRLCTEDLSHELECSDGCVTGKKGKYCDEPCPDHCISCDETFCETCEEGYHGISCENICPENCEGHCRKDTGHCQKCKLGYYGNDCQASCNSGCKTSSTEHCRFADGYCLLDCEDGFYGNQCDQRCSINCQGSTCNRDDGSCLLGCIAGWKGSHCDSPCPSNCQECTDSSCSLCKPGWYELTKECGLECSQYCQEGSCDSNGECHRGCIDGFFGPKCNQTCPDANCLKCDRSSGQCNQCRTFKYGPTCDESCPNCADGNCNKSSGECKEGCLPGFHGNKCDTPCPNSCKRREVENVLIVYCEQQTGQCLDGCVDGFYGDRCEDGCSDNCNRTLCEQTSGYCSNGCVRGKYGDFCEETCNIKCGEGKDIRCDQKNGSCIKGCQPGFHGDHCMDKCPEGCLDKFCEQASAICTYSCKEGVTGLKCDTPCPDYRYGRDCKLKCGHCVNNRTCDRFHGNCTLGCANGYDGLLCVERLIVAPSNVEETSNSAVPIVIAVVAIVLVAVVFIIGFLIYRRRQADTRQRNDKDYLMLPLHGNTVTNPSYSHSPAAPCKPLRTTPKKNGMMGGQNGHTAMAEVHQEDGEKAYYNLMGKSTTVVKTSELWSYVQQMKNSGGFQEQYDSLPTGLIHPCDIAMLPENKGKNRYKNICAFDRSRVVLDKEDDDPNSDYINANFITGYEQPKMYIASQGPVDVILVDFWRMIWQLNTSKIVMLTNIVEEGRMKCVMYWPEPDSGPIQYGHMVVECTTEDVLAHYTVRTLKICKLKQGKSKSSNTRIVKHFHFTSWPDKGVPTDVASLVEFYFKVMNTPTHGRGPMVVHCSAGIGRTGTFLALSYLVDEAKSGETVDPYRCIHRMRSERVNMVQTEEQYEFLHLALVEAIMAGGTTVPTANFQTAYQDLLQVNPETGVLKMKELFETLNLMTPAYRLEEYHTATLPDNLHRNRFKEILASDYHRPFLSTPVHGTTDYINAVFLPAYKQKRAFILTQMPMVDTVIDFWRLMFESYAQTIVMLNDDNDDKLTVGFYWPQRTLKEMYGPFLVEVVEEEDYECYKVLTLKVSKPNSDSEHDCERLVKMFQCFFWPDGQIVPGSAHPLFAVIEAVETWQIKTNQSQVTVHCLDGVERSGLYCVLSAVLERLKVEQDVSILQTINQMRVCRPQLIQSFVQFKFLYSAVHDYLETFSIYSNFT